MLLSYPSHCPGPPHSCRCRVFCPGSGQAARGLSGIAHPFLPPPWRFSLQPWLPHLPIPAHQLEAWVLGPALPLISWMTWLHHFSVGASSPQIKSRSFHLNHCNLLAFGESNSIWKTSHLGYVLFIHSGIFFVAKIWIHHRLNHAPLACDNSLG